MTNGNHSWYNAPCIRRQARKPPPFPKPTSASPPFPPPLLLAHTRIPATPILSMLYFTTPCIPGGGVAVLVLSRPSRAQAPVTPLESALTKNRGVGQPFLAVAFRFFGFSLHWPRVTEHRSRLLRALSVSALSFSPSSPLNFQLSTVNLFHQSPVTNHQSPLRELLPSRLRFTA